MNHTHDATSRVPIEVPLGGFLSWRRVLAGTFAAIAVYFLLTMLGMGLGFAVADPTSRDDSALATIGIGAGITWILSTLISLFVGGWIAGASPLYANAKAGMVQGLMVWSLVLIFSLTVVTTMAARTAGAGARAAGAAIQAVGQPLAAMASQVGGAAAQAVTQSPDQVSSFVQEALASAGQGGGNFPTGERTGTQPAGSGGAQGQPVPAGGQRQEPQQTAETIRATRELTAAMGRYFVGGADDPQARRDLIEALTVHTGMSQQEAEEAVRSWTQSYQRTQEELARAARQAEETARQAADQATRAAAHVGIWGFVAWALGAGAAVLGGRAAASRNTNVRREDPPPPPPRSAATL